jgi:protoporphyrinogen oxidase
VSGFSGHTVVLGAGPAGLTAAYLLVGEGKPVTVLERSASVGGLARTEVVDGYRFDLGGHRFFTKMPEIELMWQDILGEELLVRPRLSRIYYRGRFINYPLDPVDVVRKLGPTELTLAVASYVAATMRRGKTESTFEQWVSNRFGRRLYEMFFRSYTEKVWGVPCDELRAEWAAQRIRGLSFFSAARAALFPQHQSEIRTLINEFYYPRLGPGQMWDAMRDEVVKRGGEVLTEMPVEKIVVDGGRVTEVHAGGSAVPADQVISSLALPTTVACCSPAAPHDVISAATGLRYRDFLTVALVLSGEDPFPDTWIYVHDPNVRVARIQNFRAWSPAMVPSPETSCLGLEYFCFAGDELWSRDDDALVELAADELSRIGLADRERIERGYVVRVSQAYPVYDSDYAGRVSTIRGWLDGMHNLQQVGRNGLHRYNNCDHSMLTAAYAVANLNGSGHDLWSVNTDSWYHEASDVEEQPYLHVGNGVVS